MDKINIIIIFIVIIIIYLILRSYYNDSNYYNEYYGKIDAVYTWVNGTDPKWVAKRDSYSDKPKNEDAASAIRFENINELKYSLRSLFKYAPWINNIYIVTDDQIPTWLNTKHPKIHIIDHKDIFPDKDILPVFNSQAIECCLHKIPNLTEFFMYFNDDMFLGNTLNKQDIISSDGKPFYYGKQWTCNYKGPPKENEIGYVSAWKNNNSIMRNEFLNRIVSCPWHQSILCSKSVLNMLEEKYAIQFAVTMRSKFRDITNIAPIGLSVIYAVEIGKSINNTIMPNVYIGANKVNRSQMKGLLQKITTQKPKFFCINNITPDLPTVDLIHSFFDDYFSNKCDYEL